jgi:hypothetical protein
MQKKSNKEEHPETNTERRANVATSWFSHWKLNIRQWNIDPISIGCFPLKKLFPTQDYCGFRSETLTSKSLQLTGNWLLFAINICCYPLTTRICQHLNGYLAMKLETSHFYEFLVHTCENICWKASLTGNFLDRKWRRKWFSDFDFSIQETSASKSRYFALALWTGEYIRWGALCIIEQTVNEVLNRLADPSFLTEVRWHFVASYTGST